MRYLKIQEVCAELGVDASLLDAVCEEGLIHIKHTADDEMVVSAEDAERLRLVVLLREMEVNLPGAEVILHMREEIFAMRRQFDEVLQTLVAELRKKLPR
jgi:DNA-binding transcriptional MerR regulator